MIITCPHCQTKYQVTYDAIGSAGRKVQCAHCQEAWQQEPLTPEAPPPTPEAKKAFEAIEEDGLDEALAVEEKAVAAEVAKRLAKEKAKEAVKDEDARRQAEAGKVDPAVIRRRQKAFKRRHNAILAEQPLARLRRAARIVGAVALAAVLALAYFGRVQVVQRYPAMAGVYESVGLGVNVIGLDFSNVTTLRTLRDGKEVLIVSAQIVGLMPEPASVPAVVVTLIDSKGHGVYEWSVTPSVRDLMAGERATFDTQLTLPPGEAARVRLSFAGGTSIRESTAQPEAEARPIEHGAETEHGTVEAAPAAEEDHPVEAEAEHGAAPTEHATPEHH
jgi:predicted Zn finger-like uncharacterized protein